MKPIGCKYMRNRSVSQVGICVLAEYGWTFPESMLFAPVIGGRGFLIDDPN